MKHVLIIAVVMTGSLAVGQVESAPTGAAAGELRDYCVFALGPNPNTSSKATFCLGYMNGWMEGYIAAELREGPENPFSGDFTAMQMGSIFVAYMDRHPELKNKQPGTVLWSALTDAGLIKKKKPNAR
jgi:hypothetical protein